MPDGHNPSVQFQRTISANVGSLPRRALTHLFAVVAYLVVTARTSGLGVVPLVVATALMISGVLGTRRRHFADVALPFVAFAAFYQWLSWLTPIVTSRGVHVFVPYWIDKSIFGVGDFGERLSCNELFALNHLPLIDFITGVAYLSFLPCVFLFAAHLALQDLRPRGIRRASRFGWTFLGVNLAGFGTYVLCPVAPPWYVAAKGFGPIDPTTPASPAALARWDAMTGLPYFARFYGQATEVFGAMPSLHCAYPMLLLLFAWEMGHRRLAVAFCGYQLLMCFSAVYLQHHYVTDAIAGMLYAIAVYLAFRIADKAVAARSHARG